MADDLTPAARAAKRTDETLALIDATLAELSDAQAAYLSSRPPENTLTDRPVGLT